MAFQTIGIFENVYEWEQPEIIDEFASTGDTVEITQEYAHIVADVIVKQETFPNENRSNFLAELWLNITAGENGGGFKYRVFTYSPEVTNLYIPIPNITTSDIYASSVFSGSVDGEVPSGETIRIQAASFDLSKSLRYRPSTNTTASYSFAHTFDIRHNLDGSFPQYIVAGKATGNLGSSFPNGEIITSKGLTELNFGGRVYMELSDILIRDNTTNKITVSGDFSDVKPTPLSINRGVMPLTANSFTDEENPSFAYASPTTGMSVFEHTPLTTRYFAKKEDTIVSFQAALSFDGETPDIDYRDISIDSTNYTFELSEAERELLRVKAQGSDNVPIYYLTKIIRNLHFKPYNGTEYDETKETVNTAERVFTVVGCNPSLNPTVKDVNSDTLALTGDENTFVRYESMAEFAINATASKHATIVSQSVTCGSKTISNLPYGVIDDVESGTFIFNVTDSRSMGASSSVFKKLIEYVKPTCYQKAEIEITGETGATIKLKVNGNYFNGSFGAADNTLQLEVRHTDGNGNWGQWAAFATTPTFNGITYELETTFTGFDYGKAYVFQSRIIDKLNVVESAQYTVRMLPVFDWSEEDFNFNVPVNIDAEDLSMHGETIIRHSNTTNNTVLSASNGNIYIRPGGTDDTYNETIFYGNGNVKFNGTVTFADGTTGGGAADPTDAFADYIIAIGEESMGSNGTWYWRKWNSGKAEAWGCRNFGNMAVTTTWGNLYRGAILTQDLPNNVFIRTPDAININIVHSNYGGWICKHEQTAPSADTTGSFIFVRPASATVTPTNIGFYIAGEWK